MARLLPLSCFEKRRRIWVEPVLLMYVKYAGSRFMVCQRLESEVLLTLPAADLLALAYQSVNCRANLPEKPPVLRMST